MICHLRLYFSFPFFHSIAHDHWVLSAKSVLDFRILINMANWWVSYVSNPLSFPWSVVFEWQWSGVTHESGGLSLPQHWNQQSWIEWLEVCSCFRSAIYQLTTTIQGMAEVRITWVWLVDYVNVMHEMDSNSNISLKLSYDVLECDIVML